MEPSILYEKDSHELKAKDQKRRILEFISLFALEISVLGILLNLFGLAVIPAYLLAVVVFLPSPLITVPGAYKISSTSIICDGRKIITLRKGNKLRLNEKRGYVSILHRMKGEFLRLYTDEPERVYALLDNLLSKL